MCVSLFLKIKKKVKIMFVLATLISWMVLSLNSCYKIHVLHGGLVGSLLLRAGETMSVFGHQTDFLSQMMFFKSELFGFVLLLFL